MLGIRYDKSRNYSVQTKTVKNYCYNIIFEKNEPSKYYISVAAPSGFE